MATPTTRAVSDQAIGEGALRATAEGRALRAVGRLINARSLRNRLGLPPRR